MSAAREDSGTGESMGTRRRLRPADAPWSGQGWPGAAPARILLIDDEPQITAFVERALEHAGDEVDMAAQAADGARLAEDGGYDLVILDLIMPDMDGRAVLRAILRAHPDQAVFILSCTADPVTKAECLDLGAKDYLTKPFSLAELTARVRARLRENAHHSEIMHVGELILDACRLVADSGAGPVALTRLEFLCLRALIDHWPATRSRRANCLPASGESISTPAPTSSTSASGGCGPNSDSPLNRNGAR